MKSNHLKTFIGLGLALALALAAPVHAASTLKGAPQLLELQKAERTADADNGGKCPMAACKQAGHMCHSDSKKACCAKHDAASCNQTKDMKGCHGKDAASGCGGK